MRIEFVGGSPSAPAKLVVRTPLEQTGPTRHMATIYRKTAKGQVEVETRANRLAPRLRTTLILIDGRRTDNELSPLIPGDPAQAFHALLDGGFIEPIRIVQERAVVRPPAPPASGDSRVREFEHLRRDSVKVLIDQLGPLGEAVAMRLEKCADWAELEKTLELACQVLEYARGKAAAASYTSRFVETLRARTST